jgi:ligand-binding sensor domain-containing protein
MFTVFSEKQGLFAESITSIVEDEYGNLWLGTLEAGIVKFDGNAFTYYTEKQVWLLIRYGRLKKMQTDKYG